MSGPTDGLRSNTHIGYWNPDVVWTSIIAGDANGDGRVDFGDFALLATNFGASLLGVLAPVPPANDGVDALAQAREARIAAFSDSVDSLFSELDDEEAANQI